MADEDERPITYVIHGLFTRPPGVRKSREKYAHVNLVYNVEPGISMADVVFALDRQRISRTVPIDIRTGAKVEYIISVDKERISEGGQVLNRYGFQKKLEKDINNLEWVQPQ